MGKSLSLRPGIRSDRPLDLPPLPSAFRHDTAAAGDGTSRAGPGVVSCLPLHPQTLTNHSLAHGISTDLERWAVTPRLS
jgi:hypothetical protein